tara:strand:+ start:699 stop:911 length:213 start_codon:yes stop_codon:yes gene_type:complete
MNLQNNITDNFLDAEYQYNEFVSEGEELGITMSNEVGMVSITDENGEDYGAFRSKTFSELTYDPQNEYYD